MNTSQSINFILLIIVLATQFSMAMLPEKDQPTYNYQNDVTIINPTDTVELIGGLASWYGPGFHGEKTANREVYNQDSLTAASPFLPFNTFIQVTNLINNKSVVVRVNDRGPYDYTIKGKKVIPKYPLKAHPSRIIDLSRQAMIEIDGLRKGVIPVVYKII